jgi:hypothetical protein
MDYSAPSYSYSLPDLYSPPTYDYYSQNYGGVLPIDYGSSNILNYGNQASYNTVNDIYNNNINNLSNGLNNYSPTVNTPIDYSYLNPAAPPTTVTDYYDPGYNYDYGNSATTPTVAPIQTPVVTPTQPDYTTTPVAPVEQPTYESPSIQYNDPTASYRYDILGNLSPDAFYRSQFAPEFANEIYSNVNPNFSIDEQGNPDVATGTTTGNVTTAPLAGDFVDAQGNLITDTVGGLRPGVDLSADAEPSDSGDSDFSALYEKVPSYKSGPDYTVRGPMRGLDGLTEQDKKALLGTGVAESGKNQDEMNAIMNVIRNRAETSGKSVYDVVTANNGKTWQFSPWGKSETDAEHPMNITPSHPRYALAEKAYEDVFVNGMNNVGTAQNFYALGGMGTGQPPKGWGDKGYPEVTIGQTTIVATPGKSLEYTPPAPPMPMARATDEQLALYNPGSEYSAPMPTARPTAEEFAAYGAPPALPPLITGVGQGAEAQLPRGISAFAPTGMTPAAAEAAPAKPESDYLPGQSTMDKVTGAIPGPITDYVLGMINPVYGIPALGMKALSWVTGNNDYKSPGSMLSENLFGGPGSYGNAPKSVAGTEYVPPVEAPAEIGRLPQTAGGTPIVSEPATGPIQVPSLQFASPAGSPSNEVLTGQADETAPTAQDVIDENYSPPFQPIDKQYVLPEELANGNVTDETSFMDWNYPDKNYSLPPGGYGAEPPPGLSRNPDLVPLPKNPVSMVSAAPLPSSGGFSSSGGTPSFGGGGGGGGGPSVSVGGGGGGGGSRAAAAPTGGGSLGTVSASNFGFQGIGGINRDYRSPVIESGRTVDFGTPSRQLAYDLNLPAIQQAAMNPNSYRSYLSQYKQLFG